MSNCFHADQRGACSLEIGSCRAQSHDRRLVETSRRVVSALTIPIGLYDKRQVLRVTKETVDDVLATDVGPGTWIPQAEPGLPNSASRNKLVDRDHEPSNRRNTKRQRRRRQELLRQRHQCRRRALV